MNYYQRKSILNKTGEDPLNKKRTPHVYGLWAERTKTWIITGAYSLCKWKQGQEKRFNPLLRTEIKVYVG